MARTLGCSEAWVRQRKVEQDAGKAGQPAAAPSEETTATRGPAPGLVALPQDPEKLREVERTIHGALEKLGVAGGTLASLRSFGDLQVTTGQFLAQTVVDMQMLYTVELYNIPKRLDYIRSTYLEPKDGSTPDPMTTMFWQRAYTELLEQLGKGKDRLLEGTQAIGAMIKDAQAKEKSATKAERLVKPGW